MAESLIVFIWIVATVGERNKKIIIVACLLASTLHFTDYTHNGLCTIHVWSECT